MKAPFGDLNKWLRGSKVCVIQVELRSEQKLWLYATTNCIVWGTDSILPLRSLYHSSPEFPWDISAPDNTRPDSFGITSSRARRSHQIIKQLVKNNVNTLIHFKGYLSRIHQFVLHQNSNLRQLPVKTTTK